jgi:hypothetical protein
MHVYSFIVFFFTSVPSTEKSAGGGFDQRTNIPSPCSHVVLYRSTTLQCDAINKHKCPSAQVLLHLHACTLQLAASSRSELQHLFEFPSPAGLSGSARDATPKLITRERHRPSDEPDKHHVHIITCDPSGSNIDELASSSSILLSKCW